MLLKSYTNFNMNKRLAFLLLLFSLINRLNYLLIDPCNPNPCNNHGRCVQSGYNSYTCVCPPNYTGRKCEPITPTSKIYIIIIYIEL